MNTNYYFLSKQTNKQLLSCKGILVIKKKSNKISIIIRFHGIYFWTINITIFFLLSLHHFLLSDTNLSKNLEMNVFLSIFYRTAICIQNILHLYNLYNSIYKNIVNFKYVLFINYLFSILQHHSISIKERSGKQAKKAI